jgi:hypothetical protein
MEFVYALFVRLCFGCTVSCIFFRVGGFRLHVVRNSVVSFIGVN